MKLDTSRTSEDFRQPNFLRCEQCDGALTIPEWSEQISARCVRHLWLCDNCGYQFESWIYSSKH
jgi:uncharacterized protein with PIN domain